MISVIYRITDIDGNGKIVIERDYQHKDDTEMEFFAADAVMSAVDKMWKKVEEEMG